MDTGKLVVKITKANSGHSGALARGRRHAGPLTRRRRRVGRFVILPATAVAVLVLWVPIGQAFYYGFTDWNGSTAAWIGLSNGIPELLVNPTTGERQWRYERPPITYCTHCTGPLLYLMDDRLVRGTGIGDSHWSEPGGGVGQVDMQVAIFETAKGAVVKFLGSQVVAREPYLVHYCLYGTKGVVENGRSGHERTTGLLYRRDDPSYGEGLAAIDCDPSDPEAPVEARSGGHGTSEYFLLREFLEALETGRPVSIDARRAFELTVPGLVALESIKRGGVWLDVPQVR